MYIYIYILIFCRASCSRSDDKKQGPGLHGYLRMESDSTLYMVVDQIKEKSEFVSLYVYICTVLGETLDQA